jgi:soluble lytic murein transglycosylase-like protein
VGAITTAFALLALLAAPPAHADQVTRWRLYIDEASARFGIPAIWVERVIRTESAGLTTLNGGPITSRTGAMGLMQLMPDTWAEMRRRLGLGADPHAPRDNILAGTFYLRLMYDRFGYPGLFAAYNAGPARYVAYLATGRTLPGETRAYLVAVGGAESRTPGRVVVRPANGVFFRLGQQAETSEPAVSGDGLFVALARKGSERPTP